MSECSGPDCTHSSHVGAARAVGVPLGKASESEKTLEAGRVLSTEAEVKKALAAGAKVVYVDGAPVAMLKPGLLQKALTALAGAGADFGMSAKAARAPSGHTSRKRGRGRGGKKTATRNPDRWKKIKSRRAIRKGSRPPKWYKERGLPVPKHSRLSADAGT